jgi:hypothetical protein
MYILVVRVWLQTTFYKRFKAANPDVLIGQTSFISLKPFFVKSIKDRNLCCYKHHVELGFLRDAFNCLRRSFTVHGPTCSCNCIVCNASSDGSNACVCSSSLLTYAGITALWPACLCPKEEDDEWHGHRCLLGECDLCGVDRQLPLCPKEEFGQ